MLMDWQNQHSKNGYTPKRIYMINAIPIKIPMTFTTETKKIYPKVHLGTQKTVKSQDNTKKKSNAGSITIVYFKLYYRATAIKTAWYWHKNRYEDQWNRIEDLDMNPHSYINQKYTKAPKYTMEKIYKYTMEKRQPLQQMLQGKVLSACRKWKLDSCLSPCTSINSK
jgi:hypothetical protein